ncbi:pro-MCH [Electrophorus electricus]|uniref:pro-MCH n=1 Tax=Electrophorus electricus TaxID=8005 RepID=UPI000F09AD66|nr:pro-MCH [Electrophorus electricus]
MINSPCLILALTLLVRCNAHFSSSAEEGGAEQGSLSTAVGGDLVNMAQHGVLSSRRSSLVDGRLADEDKRKSIFVLFDAGLRAAVRGEMRPGAGSTLPALSPWRQDHTVTGTPRDNYNTNDLIPVARRDLDVLRCMIGRVYRPCWQA